jgi:hypothetical protein
VIACKDTVRANTHVHAGALHCSAGVPGGEHW